MTQTGFVEVVIQVELGEDATPECVALSRSHVEVDMIDPTNPTGGYGLDIKFSALVNELLSSMRKKGFDFRISQGIRTPQTQAKYYCQWNKKTSAMIDKDIDNLENQDAPWIASLLKQDRDIPRTSKWLTGQLPGSGWHQWGLAADCYCYVGGKQISKGSDACYKAYAEEAVRMGLTAGFYFGHQDAGHVQLPKEAGALDIYKWKYIDLTMQERFSDKKSVVFVENQSKK